MSDMPEVLANLVSIGGVSRLISLNFDSPAISEEPEVMSRLVMRKAHHFIALLVDVMMVLPSSQHQ